MPDENGLTHSTYFSFLQVFLLLYSVRTPNTYQSFCSFEVNARLLDIRWEANRFNYSLAINSFLWAPFPFFLETGNSDSRTFLLFAYYYDLKSRIVYISILQGDFFKGIKHNSIYMHNGNKNTSQLTPPSLHIIYSHFFGVWW